MGETTIGLGAGNYLRVVVRNLWANQGMDITRLMITLELSNKVQGSSGYLLWLGGRVEMQAKGSRNAHLGHLQPSTSQPIGIGPYGSDTTTQVTLDLSDRQLWLMDESRVNNGVRLLMTFTGHTLNEGQHLAVDTQPALMHDIGQSEWLDVIRDSGLRCTILVELEAPDRQANPDLAQAFDFYDRALSRYREGEWREAVESVRQTLAALVDKKADEEDQEADVNAAIGAARKVQGALGYDPRRELVRKAAKFMTDLGAHPETAETRKPDARAALLVAAGLLHAFGGNAPI